MDPKEESKDLMRFFLSWSEGGDLRPILTFWKDLTVLVLNLRSLKKVLRWFDLIFFVRFSDKDFLIK